MEPFIIKTVAAVFNGADERNWPKVQAAMADQVYLDYSSLSGNPAAFIASEQIVAAWKNFLPGFEKTHHQLSNYEVSLNGDQATVHFDGIAAHFIGDDSWTVEGTYDAEVIRTNEQWQMTRLTFHFATQSGNVNLPGEAIKRMAQ